MGFARADDEGVKRKGGTLVLCIILEPSLSTMPVNLNMLRPLGVAVTRSIALSRRGDALAVIATVPVEKGTVLAAVPESASLNALTLADCDKNGFFPPVDEFSECVHAIAEAYGEHESESKRMLAETLALAHFVSLDVFLDENSWFSSRVMSIPIHAEFPIVMKGACGLEMLTHFHQELSKRFVSVPFDHFRRSVDYVGFGAYRKNSSNDLLGKEEDLQNGRLVQQRVNQDKGHTTVGSQSSLHLIPFADLLIENTRRSKRSLPHTNRSEPNASLKVWTAEQLRAAIRSTVAQKSSHTLRGGRQHLMGKEDGTAYFAVVAESSLSAGEPITVTGNT